VPLPADAESRMGTGLPTKLRFVANSVLECVNTALDGHGQRRPRLSDPRDAEVCRLAVMRTDVQTARLDRSPRKAAAPALSLIKA
jgi:hypothetical protein